MIKSNGIVNVIGIGMVTFYFIEILFISKAFL